jgi:hypothetical protein
VLRDVPRRGARLSQLGNAVVPQIPLRLGRAILRAGPQPVAAASRASKTLLSS